MARTSKLAPLRSTSTQRSSAADATAACKVKSAASRLGSALTQHANRVAVGPAEALGRRLPPGQPAIRGVLFGRDGYRRPAGEREPENVLGVVSHPRSEAMAPLQIDLEGVGKV